MAADEALVSFFRTQHDLFALVLDGDRTAGVRIDPTGLEEEISRFRSQMDQGDPKATDTARRLHARLIAPVLPYVRGKALVFAPHGPLHYLPFAALHDGRQYLVEQARIRVVPSASALTVIPATRSSAAGTMLAIGNPDLEDPKLDLPYAEREALRIASRFPGSTVLTRKAATKEEVLRLAPSYARLHFAVHGKFRPEAPLSSGLVLARAAATHGEVRVSDIYDLSLDADLVTLSACETALGRVANGDDIIGLTRGFMYAGARSIVASLWQVDDESTEHLMLAFYRNLASHGKGEALRMAQLETLKRYPSPHHWAAFQSIGND